MMKQKVYIMVSSILILSLFAAACCLLMQESFDILQDIEKGTYRLLDQELIPREDITCFVISEDKVYIYYDKSGLVNIYLHDGSFCYGIQVPTLKSGKGDIAINKGFLYIDSRGSTLFVFNNSELVELLEPSNDPNKYITLRGLFTQEKNNIVGGNQYRLDTSSNNIVSIVDNSVLIDLPEKSRLADSLLIAGLLTLGISCFLYTCLFKDNRLM